MFHISYTGSKELSIFSLVPRVSVLGYDRAKGILERSTFDIIVSQHTALPFERDVNLQIYDSSVVGNSPSGIYQAQEI